MTKRSFAALRRLLLAFALCSPAAAQLRGNTGTAPVIAATITSTSPASTAHKKFWVDTLGGTAMKFGRTVDVIEFPDIFMFLRVQAPTGPTRGTAFDHIGFAVPNVPTVATKIGGERLSAHRRAASRSRAGRGAAGTAATTAMSPTYLSAPTARRSSS